MSAARSDFAEKSGTDWLPYVTAGLSVIVLFGVLIYPIFTTLTNSFIRNGEAITVSNLTLANFWTILESNTYRSAIWHSLVVAVLSSLFAVLLALPMAYCMTRVKISTPIYRCLFMGHSAGPQWYDHTADKQRIG